MLYHTEIGESAEISVSKNFLLQGEEATGYIKLSDYQPYELVLSFPLTLTDCHLAMQTAIVKARLIGIEFGRRKKPFFKRTSSENALQSDSREFDTILRSIKNEFDEALEIRSIKELSGSNERLRDVLTNPLVAHKDFEGISTKFKRSLLRVEKDFGQNVAEPLKKAMINKSRPDFPSLLEQTTHYGQGIITVCVERPLNIEKVCSKIKATEGWREATKLNEKIEALQSRAKTMGWNRWEDESFKELQPETLFRRADGPSSVITYLEGLLNRLSGVDSGLSEVSMPRT